MTIHRCSAAAGMLALALAATACDGGDPLGPPGAGRVSLSVVVPTVSSGSASVSPAFDLEQTDGTNTLVLEEIGLVLWEVELEGEEEECEEHTDDSASSDGDASEEDGSDHRDDDDCHEVEAGPFLVDLPLDGAVETILAIDVPAGTYDELEFEIHKAEDDDEAFVAAYPEFAGISLRVLGRYNGVPFEFTQDLDAEQEVELFPPLTVEEGASPANVTLSIDASTWFVGPDGSVIDPATAADGGPNEDLVEDNIEESIEGFEDDDEDGDDDHRKDGADDDSDDDEEDD